MSRGALRLRLWRTEWGLSAMLLFLVLALFVGAPLAAMGVVGGYLFDLFYSLLLLSGVIAVSGRRMLAAGISTVAIATLAVRWASHQSTEPAIVVWENALSILSLAILMAMLLGQVFRDGPITGYRIQGSIAVYLLLGLMWTSAYQLLYAAVPGAFQFPASAAEPSQAMHSLVYYSLVTLTTIGYGDITPVHPVARSLASAEALVGQLYPAILIARLVSMQVESGRRK